MYSAFPATQSAVIQPPTATASSSVGIDELFDPVFIRYSIVVDQRDDLSRRLDRAHVGAAQRARLVVTQITDDAFLVAVSPHTRVRRPSRYSRRSRRHRTSTPAARRHNHRNLDIDQASTSGRRRRLSYSLIRIADSRFRKYEDGRLVSGLASAELVVDQTHREEPIFVGSDPVALLDECTENITDARL